MGERQLKGFLRNAALNPVEAGRQLVVPMQQATRRIVKGDETAMPSAILIGDEIVTDPLAIQGFFQSQKGLRQ